MPRWVSEIALPLVSGAALFFGLVVLNWSEVLFEFPSVTRAAEAPAATLKDIADVVDQVVSMLMTIGIGLFVFFGFAIKYFFDKGVPISIFAGLLAFLFLIFEMIAITLGYFARAEILSLMIDRQAAFHHLSAMVARQALFVHLSFVTGVVVSIHVILVERRTGSEGTLPTPVHPQPPVNPQPPGALSTGATREKHK